MRVDEGVQQPATTPPLPRSIWVVALAAVAGQVVWLAQAGVRSDDGVSVVGSVALGALLVGYISAGVVRARTIRLGIAWLVLVLSLVSSLDDAISVGGVRDTALDVLSLAAAAAALAGLARFHGTAWHAWQRTRPPAHHRGSIGHVVAVGVLVGVMAGIVAPGDDGLGSSISVSG